MTLTFDLLTVKSVWESHVTWGTHVQSFVFLCLFGFRVRADVRDIRQTDDGRRSSLNAPGAGHNNLGIHTLHGEYSFWLIHVKYRMSRRDKRKYRPKIRVGRMHWGPTRHNLQVVVSASVARVWRYRNLFITIITKSVWDESHTSHTVPAPMLTICSSGEAPPRTRCVGELLDLKSLEVLDMGHREAIAAPFGAPVRIWAAWKRT